MVGWQEPIDYIDALPKEDGTDAYCVSAAKCEATDEPDPGGPA